MLVWQTTNYDFHYYPELAKTVSHKTHCPVTHVLKLWLHTLPKHSSVHTVLHVYILCRTHTDTCQNHALTHADKITDAEAPYSQRVKRAGSVHLHSCGLHICLFFPEGAPPALGELWKSCWWCSAESVSQGGGSGARPGISNRHTESRTEDQPRSSSAEERASAHWKHTVHQHAASHRYCFTHRRASPSVDSLLKSFSLGNPCIPCFHLCNNAFF